MKNILSTASEGPLFDGLPILELAEGLWLFKMEGVNGHYVLENTPNGVIEYKPPHGIEVLFKLGLEAPINLDSLIPQIEAYDGHNYYWREARVWYYRITRRNHMI